MTTYSYTDPSGKTHIGTVHEVGWAVGEALSHHHGETWVIPDELVNSAWDALSAQLRREDLSPDNRRLNPLFKHIPVLRARSEAGLKVAQQ
jgi:hypothetical protein